MGHGMKALVIAALLVGSINSAEAVVYRFEYITPMGQRQDGPVEPGIAVTIDDSIWMQGGRYSGDEYFGSYWVDLEAGKWIPYRGVSANTALFRQCDPVATAGGPLDCNVASNWLQADALKYDLEVRGNFLVGNLYFANYGWAYYWSYSISSGDSGVWSFSNFDSDQHNWNCSYPGGCPATGRFRQVPEPGTLALLGLGLAGLGLIRRRKAN